MPGVTRAHGYAGAGEFVSRDLWYKNFAKEDSSVISQADLDALVQTVQLTSTIEVIGSITVDVDAEVNMIISGANVTAVTGYTVTDITGF